MHTISSLTDTLVRPELAPGTGAYTLSLSHLCRCVIDLCPPHATEPERGPELGLSSVDGTARTTLTKPTLTTLHAKDLQQCIMIAPVLPGSAMLSEMVDCLVIVGAQQVCVLFFFLSFFFAGDFSSNHLLSSLEYIPRPTLECC